MTPGTSPPRPDRRRCGGHCAVGMPAFSACVFLGVALLWTGLCAGSIHAGYRPSYRDLRGPRFNNAAGGTWDVGWSEDIHAKRIEAWIRPMGAAGAAAGATAGTDAVVGSFTAVYAATEVDLYVVDLSTKAAAIEFWLTTEEDVVSARSRVKMDGRGRYRIPLALKRTCSGERLCLRVSSPEPVRFGWAYLHVPLRSLFPTGIEGIYLSSFATPPANGKSARLYPVQAFTGKRALRLSDFNVQRIPLPRLGVGVDLRLCDVSLGDYVTRIFADNGRLVHAGRRTRRNTSRVTTGRFGATRVYLDSLHLDTDGDGYWAAPVLRTIDTMDVPAGLGYSLIIPATWFDAPSPPKRSARYATLRFEYRGLDGTKSVALPLRKDYFNPDGSVRIGFVHYSSYNSEGLLGGSIHKVYVIQSCRKGGIIIGFVNRLDDFRCLQIVKDSLHVSERGEAILPRFGRKISCYQQAAFYQYSSNATEFEIYGYSRVCNTLITRILMRGWVYPPKLIWNDPYVRSKTKREVDRCQFILDRCRQYGMQTIFDTNSTFVPDLMVHHPTMDGEYFHPAEGRFSKARLVRSKGWLLRDVPFPDVMDPVVVDLLESYWTEFFAYFERLEFVQASEAEVGNRSPPVPFYSLAALQHYRATVNDPAARFPVKPGAGPTPRTFATPTKTDWQKYNDWKLSAHTDGRVLVLGRAAQRAFEGNPHYKGFSFLEATIPTRDPRFGIDLTEIFGSPAVSLWVNEHGFIDGKNLRKVTPQIPLARKQGKTCIMLANLFRTLGPGDIPDGFKRGVPWTTYNWQPEEAFWVCDRLIFRRFPELDGMCWHHTWTEPLIRFWMAYQTVEWDRGLMPKSEAMGIMRAIRNTYARQTAFFEYDVGHKFHTLQIPLRKERFDILTAKAEDLAALPAHTLDIPVSLLRGEAAGDTFRATFKVVAAGPDVLQFFVEVDDRSYTGLDTRKYTFPRGRAWAGKDKVDIYLGCTTSNRLWQFGGGIAPGRRAHEIPRTMIWIEARCGEEQLVCYFGRRANHNLKDKARFACGRAKWRYLEPEAKWQGRIRVNLGRIKQGLTADKLTGFNLGIQDVDEGVENVRYMMYEPYPKWVNAQARYADVEIVD